MKDETSAFIGVLVMGIVSLLVAVSFKFCDETGNACFPMSPMYNKPIQMNNQWYVICSDPDGGPVLTKKK